MRRSACSLFLIIVCLMLGGCGTLSSSVVTNRKLTKEEITLYNKQKSASRIIPAIPVFVNGKFLNHTEGNKIQMAQVFSIIIPPLAPPAVLYSQLSGAEFGQNGKQQSNVKHFSVFPFYSETHHCQFDQKENPHETLVSRSVLVFFGWGELNGKPFYTCFVPLGIKREELEKAKLKIKFTFD